MRVHLLAAMSALLLYGCDRWSESAKDWNSLKGKELRVAEIKCAGGEHCHFKVAESPPGTFAPERYLWITDAQQTGIDFEIFTPKKDGGRERTICGTLAPVSGNPGKFKGRCMLPGEAGVPHDHEFNTALKLRANGTKSVYFSFADIVQGGVGTRHNGEGHTTDQ
jgi:hypothetical protein